MRSSPGRVALLPVLVAIVAGGWVLGTGPVGAQSGQLGEEESFDRTAEDPLGYVIDVDVLDDPEVIAAGKALYDVGCVSCHLQGGVGGDRGPTIVDAGAASAHFYLTSGRMPLANEGQADRKDPAYARDEIAALVAYVASLGDGPAIPDVDLAAADLQRGGELYRLNCAACHQAAGAGGALSYGNNAPTLMPATPVQVVEAMLVGPGQMPVFEQLTPEERDDIARYVVALQEVEDPGGLSLGRIGPIPEGFVAIVIGTGACLLAALWIGRRRADQEATEGAAHP
jgi:ubiquinol-cytochrome c reductase cytochrome c subunit